jgi:hypothetical protein
MKKLSLVVVVLLLVCMATYGSGWVDGGNTVRLSQPGDSVGIGVTNALSKLHVVSYRRGPIADEKRAAIFGYNANTDYINDNGIGLMGKAHGDESRAIYGYSLSGGYGGFFRGRGYFSESVGIGTQNTGSYMLAVNGAIRAKAIKVETGWSDFVFADNYKLMPLDKLEKHIKVHKSLPGIPTEKEVLENGVELGEMQAKFLEKIEELTLYVIELKKENEELKSRISALDK